MAKQYRKNRRKNSQGEIVFLILVLLVAGVAAFNSVMTSPFAGEFLFYFKILIIGALTGSVVYVLYWGYKTIESHLAERNRKKAIASKKIEKFNIGRGQQFFMSMTSYQFEEYVAWVYKQKGYETEVTPPSKDKGIDVFS